MTFPTRATTAENARDKASIGLAGDASTVHPLWWARRFEVKPD